MAYCLAKVLRSADVTFVVSFMTRCGSCHLLLSHRALRVTCARLAGRLSDRRHFTATLAPTEFLFHSLIRTRNPITTARHNGIVYRDLTIHVSAVCAEASWRRVWRRCPFRSQLIHSLEELKLSHCSALFGRIGVFGHEWLYWPEVEAQPLISHWAESYLLLKSRVGLVLAGFGLVLPNQPYYEWLWWLLPVMRGLLTDYHDSHSISLIRSRLALCRSLPLAGQMARLFERCTTASPFSDDNFEVFCSVTYTLAVAV